MSDAALRFRMSGRIFTFDPDAKTTLLDLATMKETGLNPTSAGKLLEAVAAGARAPDIDAVLAIGALAYLAATREGSTETWREFARTIQPETLEFVEAAPVAAETTQRAEQVAAADVLSLPDLAARVNQLMAEREARPTA